MPTEINLVWVQSPRVDHDAVTDEEVRWCTLTPGICVLNAIIFICHSTALQLTYSLSFVIIIIIMLI